MKAFLPEDRERNASALLNVGLTADQVRALWVPKKNSRGRSGLPEHVVRAMYSDYQRLKSVEKVGELYGRTRQSIHELFRKRGLAMQPNSRQKMGKVVVYAGESFTWSRRSRIPYWRATSGRRRRLERVMWERERGPIPPGWQVSFLDGNAANPRIENLFCAPIDAVTRHHFRRLHPELGELTPEERHRRRKSIGLAGYYRRRDEYRARGLRCDGKELAAQRKRRGAPPTTRRPREYEPEPGSMYAAWLELRDEMRREKATSVIPV